MGKAGREIPAGAVIASFAESGKAFILLLEGCRSGSTGPRIRERSARGKIARLHLNRIDRCGQAKGETQNQS
jgi:hypothetical protein